VAIKEACYQPVRGGADDYSIRLREPLQPCGEIGRLTQGQLFPLPFTADLAHNHQTCVDPNPDLQEGLYPPV
jgi:hypothetical protein